MNFESAASSRQDADDTVLPRGDLDGTVAFRSFTADVQAKPGAVDGLALNIIAPHGARPEITLTLNAETRVFTLPEHFQDKIEDVTLDTEGHFVVGHIHWCWWKAPNGDGL